MTSTLLTVRGMGDPVDMVDMFFDGTIAAAHDAVSHLGYVQTGLEGVMAAFSQVLPPAAQITLDAAADLLEDNLVDLLAVAPGDTVTVMAYSVGALVAVTLLARHGSSVIAGVDPARVNFILVGNPARKYNGEFTVVGGQWGIETLVIPAGTAYTTLDVTNQYDPWGDWPDTLRYTSSYLPAVANAVAGLPTAHVIDYVNRDSIDPADGIDQITEGNVTYRLLPTFPLPLLALTPNPPRDWLDASIRPLVEASYNRPGPPVVIEPPPDIPYDYGDCDLNPAVEPAHFCSRDGIIEPQPWMQWRQVSTVSARSKSGSYPVTMTSGGIGTIDIVGTLGSLFGSLFGWITTIFGENSFLGGLVESADNMGNKNDLIHSLQTSYTNESPVDQWVYGTITRGGARVTLQARSRGGLLVTSGYAEDLTDPGVLTPSSMIGVGADMARAGTLATGTSFGIAEERQNSVTFPLAPERTGWHRLPPGATLTAKCEVRFVSEFWENTTIDGGSSECESSYESGDTRLDLFAIPVLE